MMVTMVMEEVRGREGRGRGKVRGMVGEGEELRMGLGWEGTWG